MCGSARLGRASWLVVVLFFFLILLVMHASPRPAAAHETDNYSMPPERAFADYGPMFTRVFYRNLRRGAAYTNDQIRQAERNGQSRRADRLRSPDAIALHVRRMFPHTLSLIDDIDRLCDSPAARQRFPGQLTYYEPFDYIYSHSSFILDPRQVFKLWRSPTIQVADTYIGTDKIGHFLAKGYINFERYREALRDGVPRQAAIDHAVAIGTGGDFFYSEKRMVGYFSSGVLSHGDLAADYLGLKFYINLTEPVLLRGEKRPPLLTLVNGTWQLNDHVRPDTDFFTVYISDHLNEALNPNIYLKGMRPSIRKQIVERREDLLARYGDRFGNRRGKAWFEQRMRALSTYYGENYGHEQNFRETVSVAGTCFPDFDYERDPAKRSPLGRTWLHQAAVEGEVSAARATLAAGADVNAEVRSNERHSAAWGNRPLHYAVREGHVDVARLLIRRGADVNAANDRGVTALHRAAQVGGPVLSLLLDHGADVDAADAQGRTPLHWAVTYESTCAAEALLSAGAAVHASDSDGRAPMHYAAAWDRAAVIEVLARMGADVNGRARFGVTPIYTAARSGNVNAVRALARRSANVNAADELGRTPLHVAAAGDHTQTAKTVLDAGASARVADAYGQTPLHEAAGRNNTPMMRALLARGAEPNSADGFGRTPLHTAAMGNHDAAMRLLADRGGDVTRTDDEGNTVRMLADRAPPNLVDRFIRLGQSKYRLAGGWQ